MNEISKLIYLAGLADNLQNFILFLIVISGFLVIVSVFSYAIAKEAKNNKLQRKSRIYCNVTFCLCILFWVIQVFIPSQKTVLAIAASEATGIAINSAEARRTLDTVLKHIESKVKE